ncbi:MAG: serine--tRNA ligase, partial [Bacteroidales bacterium]
MLNIRLLREQPDYVTERLRIKNFDAAEIIRRINTLDIARRNSQTELDNILSEQNTLAKEIGALMKSGKRDEAEVAKSRVVSLKEESKSLEERMNRFADELNELLVQLPNLPHSS